LSLWLIDVRVGGTTKPRTRTMAGSVTVDVVPSLARTTGNVFPEHSTCIKYQGTWKPSGAHTPSTLSTHKASALCVRVAEQLSKPRPGFQI